MSNQDWPDDGMPLSVGEQMDVAQASLDRQKAEAEEFTPTTQRVRDRFIAHAIQTSSVLTTVEKAGAAFDRWHERDERVPLTREPLQRPRPGTLHEIVMDAVLEGYLATERSSSPEQDVVAAVVTERLLEWVKVQEQRARTEVVNWAEAHDGHSSDTVRLYRLVRGRFGLTKEPRE